MNISTYINLYKCKNATVIVHICTIIVAWHLIFYYFFLSPLHSFFFFFLSGLTLTSRSLFLHLSLLLSQVSPQLCHCWSPHLPLLSPIAVAIFFLCLMVLRFWLVGFDGFDRWFWWFWLVGFDGFDRWFWWFWLVVLRFWWMGWWWRLGWWLPLLSFFFVWSLMVVGYWVNN